MVREFEDLPDEQLVVVVDALGAPMHSNGAANDGEPVNSAPINEMEQALSFASSICWDYCRHKGNRLALVLAGAKPLVIEGTTGMPLALEMLEALAVMPNEAPDDAALIDKLVETDLPTGPMLLVTVRDSGLAPSLSRALGRPVAQINVARGEEVEFFEMPETANTKA